MSRCSKTSPIGVAIALAIVSSGCGPRLLKREIHDRSEAAKIDHDAGYLKAHMLDGALCVLSQWHVDEDGWQLTGSGVRYDANRDTSAVGNLIVSIDSVALFETNSAPVSPAIGPMLLMTGASAAMTIYCAANPKACFGSCPTFYDESGDGARLVAEGFSSSISPCLEAVDIDALGPRSASAPTNIVRITMKNEALETHAVELSCWAPHT